MKGELWHQLKIVLADRTEEERVSLQTREVDRHHLVAQREVVVDCARSIVVERVVLIIDTESESELQLFGEAECRLMEDSGIEHRSVEVATHQDFAVGEFHAHRHCHSHHRDFRQVAVDAAFEEAHAIAHESHRTLGVEVLVHEVDARNPVPAVVALALHCQLIAEGAQFLLLLESVDV